jgi:nucleoside phosphorylase
VEPIGVGVAAAAAGTARLLTLAEAAGTPYRAVLSAGVAGGFPGHAEMGATVIGARSIAADLGAETTDGFVGIAEMGLGAGLVDADAGLLRALASALPGSVLADILTVATVTGTAATAARRRRPRRWRGTAWRSRRPRPACRSRSCGPSPIRSGRGTAEAGASRRHWPRSPTPRP